MNLTSDLVLGQLSDREDRARELLRGEPEQEVGLVLAGVAALEQPGPAAPRIAVRPRVMPGGDVLDAEGTRLLDQALEVLGAEISDEELAAQAEAAGEPDEPER